MSVPLYRGVMATGWRLVKPISQHKARTKNFRPWSKGMIELLRWLKMLTCCMYLTLLCELEVR